MTADPLTRWLETHGLSLCAFRFSELPENVAELVSQAAPDTATLPTSKLLLLANVGPLFWRCLQATSLRTLQDPVDAYSLELANQLNGRFLGNEDFVQLYPTPAHGRNIPLMRLGALAGWNIPSPLGLGLHPEYGPWSAYRAAWLAHSDAVPARYVKKLDAQTTPNLNALQESASLCVGCAAPCADACPANAVRLGENFNLESCFEHRAPKSSACHTDCFARKACPIGADFHYDDEQIAHHMGMRWRET